MPGIKDPKKVQYLALQGGGGKGFTFLGAVHALEHPSLAILPVKGDGKDQLQGISGASAGAITACLLALGARANELHKIMADQTGSLSFFDQPDPGFARGVRANDFRARKRLTDTGPVSLQERLRHAARTIDVLIRSRNEARKEILEAWSQLFPVSYLLSGPQLAPLAAIIAVLSSELSTKAKSNPHLAETYPFLGPILKEPLTYLGNLLYDLGFFPGFGVRHHLRKLVATLVRRHPGWRRNPGLPDPGDIDFAMLRDITGIDLVVTGTNVSRRGTINFSPHTTPRFPVIEAVGISACFPFMFKPIWVDAAPSEQNFGPLTGAYIDGGFLNNFPVHAFDDRASPQQRRDGAGSCILNPSTLGLQLIPGAPRSRTGNFSVRTTAEPVYDFPILSFSFDMFETIYFPSSEGQIRSREEKDQTIDLFTFGLSTFDFAPSEAATRLPVREAYSSVLQYFKVK